MKEIYDEIIRLGDILEENGIDFVKSQEPAKAESIEQWEKSNGCILPKGYKELVLFANGIRYGMTSIYSINQVKKDEYQFKGYYVIGEYIGDGSMLLCDDKGKTFTGDHEFGVEEVDFKAFVQEWMLRIMEDDLNDNDVEFDKPIISMNTIDKLLAELEAEEN